MELTKAKMAKIKEDERAALIFIYEEKEQLLQNGFIEILKKLGDLVSIAVAKVDFKDFKKKSIIFLPMGDSKEKEKQKEFKFDSTLQQIIELLYENIEDNSRKMNPTDY